MRRTGPWSANSPRPGSPRPWCSRRTGLASRPPTRRLELGVRRRHRSGRAPPTGGTELRGRRVRPTADASSWDEGRVGLRPADREPDAAVRTPGLRPWRWPRTGDCWRPRTTTAGCELWHWRTGTLVRDIVTNRGHTGPRVLPRTGRPLRSVGPGKRCGCSTRRPVGNVSRPPPPRRAHATWANPGRSAARDVGASDGFEVWDPATGRRARTPSTRNCSRTLLAVSPDGRHVAGCGEAGRVRTGT